MSKEALAVFEEATVESVFMQCRDLARGSSEIFICLPKLPLPGNLPQVSPPWFPKDCYDLVSE